jgi:acyl-coenzyme A thioesterase PaaI-like protein
MEVTLGSAFEGAPGRAHGGIVAALVDETMGLVLAMNDVLAYTVQLDISYLAPTPLHEPIRARAWLKERNGRKLSISASVHANEINLATASALFIEISAEKFLASVAVRD